MPYHVVYEALRAVAIHNSPVPGLSRDSTAFKTIGKPCYFWRKTEERRHGVQQPVQPQAPGQAPLRGYEQWMSRREDENDIMSAYNQKGTKHPAACELLNRPIDYDEVNAALLKLKDVGVGPDNLPPIVLFAHADHGPNCKVIRELVQDFKKVFKTGVAPESWQNYRKLLHHKGHDAHQTALDSYRALASGTVLKILCQWSLRSV